MSTAATTAATTATATATADVSRTTRVRALALEELGSWDALVARFPGHRVGHSRAWVDSLAAAGHGTPLFLVFERGTEVTGCLPGLLVRVAGYTLFGSPLPGWQTASMGPVFDADALPQAELIEALVSYLERFHQVAHIELMLSGLDGAVLRGAGFRGSTVGTFRAPLHPGAEETTFAGLRDSARRNIRRAERLGVEIRMGVDAEFVDVHYAQLREVYLRGGNAIPFSKRRLAAGIEEMHRAGKLIAVSAYLPGDAVRIATATFFADGDELQLWMWAHSPAHRWYRVTELLTWRAMQRAMAIGCTRFDLMGRGDFKMKFGATLDETKQRWVRSRSPVLAAARPIAHGIFQAQQMIRGRIGRAFLSGAPSGSGHLASRRPAIACVLGDIDLVRALGLAGIRSDVVAPPGAPSRYSRHTRHALDWIDPFAFPDQLVDLLVRYGQAQERPPTLFYQDDASLLLISRHRARLARAFRFVVPEATLVDDLADKARFQVLAARLGLPVPAARALDPAREHPPTDLPFDGPFILKPLMRRPETWGPLAGTRKALLLHSLAELQLWWPRLAQAGISVLAQALVPGPERGIESYHVYVDAHGERVAEFTGRKIRTYPAEFGDSSAVEIVDLPDLAEVGRDLTKRLGLRGVAKFDFKRRPDGTFALLEVNPRFTLWHHPAACAGLNIPALVHEDVAGLGRARPAAPARSGVRWCKVWTDHAAARAEGVPFLAWLLWAMRCEAKRAIAWGDPLPLLEAGARAILARQTGSSVPAMGLRS